MSDSYLNGLFSGANWFIFRIYLFYFVHTLSPSNSAFKIMKEINNKHLKMTCKCMWCCSAAVQTFHCINEEYLMTEYELINDFGGLFIRAPTELLCCLTGTCTNSLNHGRINGVADFPPALLQPVSPAPLMNANWAFFGTQAFHIRRDCWILLSNWHLCYVWATAHQLWSLNQWW